MDPGPTAEITKEKMCLMSNIAAWRGAGWTEGHPALPAQSSILFSPQQGFFWVKVRTSGAGVCGSQQTG